MANTKKGATRKAMKPSKERRVPWKGILYVCFISLLSFGLYKVNWNLVENKILTVVSRPVTNVIIEGSFVFVDKARVEGLVRDELAKDFVNVDIRSIKQGLSTDAWVQKVEIKRVWPETLRISIEEQKPIANWGDEGFINQQGELVFADVEGKLKGLPKFTGTDSSREELVRWYLNSQYLFREIGLEINGIHVDDKNDWVFNVNNKVEIIVGSENKANRMDMFVKVFKAHLKNKFDAVKKVDLRYANAFSVEWQATQDLVSLNK